MDILTETTGQREPGLRRWAFADYAKKGVQVSLVLSLVIFAMYLVGSLPDPGFSDYLLFVILRMLRYASLLLLAFSVFALGFSVPRLVNYPQLRNALWLFFYFSVGMLGAILAMLDSFMVAAAGGNV
jgi:hypothetical protein